MKYLNMNVICFQTAEKMQIKVDPVLQSNVQPYVMRCASSSLNSIFAGILTPKLLVRFSPKFYTACI